MQLGGDDQWSNLLAGTDLIRRKLGKNAYAMTNALLLNSEGQKMGKTVQGAVWIDANKTSPFEFFQYWRNVADSDVINFLKMMTFLPLDEIDEMSNWQGSKLNDAKEVLAYEVTKLVHGALEADKAKAGAHALFAGGAGADIPTTVLTEADFENEAIDIVSLLVKGELVSSRSDGRRAVEQGGVSVDDEKVADFKETFAKSKFVGEGLLVKRGKKHYRKFVV